MISDFYKLIIFNFTNNNKAFEMQENENSFNLDLIDLRGSEGVFDYCSKTNIIVYSVGSMLIYWELVKDKKLYINYHESTIGAIKISDLGNYFISIDKNKYPNIIFWEIPTLNVLYQSKLSVNFRSDKDKFPEETKFLRDINDNTNFNFKKEMSKNSGLIISDILIEFYKSNFICILINIDQYDDDIFHSNGLSDNNLYRNNSRSYKPMSVKKQIFYFFEILNNIKIKFLKVIDNQNHCYGMKSFLNGNLVSMEQKLIKFWKIDCSQNKIKLKTKIHIKQKLLKNQLQICEYLRMIIILNENKSCIILDETGVFLISINPDFNPLTNINKFQTYESEKDIYEHSFESFILINVFNETLFLSTNKGNILIYNLNGFKYVGKIEYNNENKKKFLLNNQNKSKNKSMINLENLDLNGKENQRSSSGFFIKNLFIDEENDIIVANYSDNSISIFPYSTSIKISSGLLGSKYKKPQPFFNSDILNKNQFNLEYNGNLNNYEKKFFLFSHFEKITDICWLNNNYKSFISSSTDQSLMLWNYRGDKWVNCYFDLLKIFDKNLNNFENQVLNEVIDTNLENVKNIFNNEKKVNEKSIQDTSLFKMKYFINVIISHPKRGDILIGGDNKGNIYQFDCELKEQPKKFVVGNFPINTLSFSRNGSYMSVGFSTGNIILVDFNNNCKFCTVIEEINNDDTEIRQRSKQNMLLSYCHLFKKYTYIDSNINNIYRNSESENNVIKILSMNSFKTLRIQLIKKSLLTNNSNLTKDIRGNLNYVCKDKKDIYGNIPNNYFNSTLKNMNYNFKIKKIEMHVSEEYLIILFDNNSILINRLESNSISGVITLNNQYLEFYDIKCDPSGLYLAVLSDAFANQESLDFKSFHKDENFNSGRIDEKGSINNKRDSNFDFSSNKNYNSLDKNKSIELKLYNIRRTENKDFDRNLYKSTIKSSLENKYGDVKLNSSELSCIRDNIRKKSSLILYEIGTGNFVCILKNIFMISTYKFSNDGRFICITSDSGCVSVWNTCGDIRENILSVLEESKINPNFWESFRINFRLENGDKFDFFQKIEMDDNNYNKNYASIKSLEEKEKNFDLIKNRNKNKQRIFERTKDNRNNNFSSSNERYNFDKSAISKERRNTQFNTNRIGTNIPSNMNYAKFTTTHDYNDTSHKSLYLNINNSNFYKNTSRAINSSSFNIEENLLNKSSRGKIYSNYPLPNKDNNFELKNSHSSNENKKNFSPNNKQRNLLYSSSNLYRKNFQVNQFVNLDNRTSKNFSKLSDKENDFANNDLNFQDIHKDKLDLNSKDRSSNDYLINFSKEKMLVNVYPDPDNIDDIEINNYKDNNSKKVSSPQYNNQIEFNPNSGNIITEEFFENSKIKGSTADQIEFVDNNINYFEKNILKGKDLNNTSSNKYSRNDYPEKDKFKNNSFTKDSIDG